jgi:Flp pilus assembly protein TadG
MRPSRRRGRRGQSGATIVEFALIAPLAFMLLFGLLSACWLFYQSSAIQDGATAGARTASIETSLALQDGPGGPGAGGLDPGLYCESGSPTLIEQAVARAAPTLKINSANLCASSTPATQLTQTPNDPTAANITVTCNGSCAAPTKVRVSITFNGNGIAPPLNFTYPISATSKVPVLAP